VGVTVARLGVQGGGVFGVGSMPRLSQRRDGLYALTVEGPVVMAFVG
jgi:hypothetical protein